MAMMKMMQPQHNCNMATSNPAHQVQRQTFPTKSNTTITMTAHRKTTAKMRTKPRSNTNSKYKSNNYDTITDTHQ